MIEPKDISIREKKTAERLFKLSKDNLAIQLAIAFNKMSDDKLEQALKIIESNEKGIKFGKQVERHNKLSGDLIMLSEAQLKTKKNQAKIKKLGRLRNKILANPKFKVEEL